MSDLYLYHFSEDPNIEQFVPRPGRHIEGRPENEKLVWAIDEWHSPVYFFPRDCPRIMLWPVEGSTEEDIDHWVGDGVRMAAHIEKGWAERLARCKLFKYTFDSSGFENLHDHGVHVSQIPVEPLEVEPVGDLEAAIAKANVRLNVMDSLQPLAEAWHSTLWFSGVRLRNAKQWTPPV